MRYTAKDHTFALCAYRESPYLEECIQSLLNQTTPGEIVMVTSTYCEYIQKAADKYHLKLRVNNSGDSRMVTNWNFGYSQAETPLVTIVHQDDIYEPEYVERLVALINSSKHPLIAFSDYGELRNGQKVYHNQLLRIKRILLSPLRIKLLRGSKFIRRRSLSLGNGICCPSVMFARQNLPDVIFQDDFQSSLDWQAWERLSKLNGDFLYYPKPLILHRIHGGSGTSRIIADGQRKLEDFEMFSKFWPPMVAKALAKMYSRAEKSNDLNRQK